MTKTEVPSIEVNKAEVFEAGETNSFETVSETFVPNPLSELVRRLEAARNHVLEANEFALVGDRALIVGLAVQIDAIAELFVKSAEAMAAKELEEQEEDEEVFPLVDEDDEC